MHCAGTVAAGAVDTPCATAAQDWDRVLAVNVTGVWSVSRALLPLMGEGATIAVDGGRTLH